MHVFTSIAELGFNYKQFRNKNDYNFAKPPSKTRVYMACT